MGWNNGKSKKKWDEWKGKEEDLLRKEGFSDENIATLHQFDWNQRNRDRSFYKHTWLYPSMDNNPCDPSESNINYSYITVKDDQELMDAIKDERLIKALQSDERLMLIAFYIVNNLSREEIADHLHITTNNLYVIIHRAKKEFKNKK